MGRFVPEAVVLDTLTILLMASAALLLLSVVALLGWRSAKAECSGLRAEAEAARTEAQVARAEGAGQARLLAERDGLIAQGRHELETVREAHRAAEGRCA